MNPQPRPAQARTPQSTPPAPGRALPLHAALAALALTLTLAGCTPNQSVVNPAGPQATGILSLFWLYLGVAIAVQLLVTLALVPIIRRQRYVHAPPALAPDEPARHRRAVIVVGVLVGLTAITLAVLLVGDYLTGRGIHSLYSEPAPLRISITAKQWWWDIEYGNEAEPYKSVKTANELHLPVGRTIELDLNSFDVIHSFWVPNLSGKKDMIPGHPTTLRLRADRPGTYIAQCAEYCGDQHAQMRLTVVVQPADQFQAWLAARLQDAPEPATDAQKRGQRVFLTSSCVMCHQIDGTPARSRLGPVLTHLAARPTLGAGALHNNRGNLAGWILNPHSAKPGVKMPRNNFTPDELQDLLDYLETLK